MSTRDLVGMSCRGAFAERLRRETKSPECYSDSQRTQHLQELWAQVPEGILRRVAVLRGLGIAVGVDSRYIPFDLVLMP